MNDGMLGLCWCFCKALIFILPVLAAQSWCWFQEESGDLPWLNLLAALSLFWPLHEHASTFLLFFHLQAMTKDNNKRLRVIIPLFIYLLVYKGIQLINRLGESLGVFGCTG